MANNFQVDRSKYKKGIKDIYKREKNFDKNSEIKSKNEKLREGFKVWTSFYRANIHRFIVEYFGIDLHLFQMILVYLMNTVMFFMYVAARGQGKSFIIAIFCCARCVLYPNTKVILASGTKGQSTLIITQKIEKELMPNYPNLAREIKQIKTGSKETVVIFHNGSTIEAVTSTDNSRGYRGNILILDEFRMIKKDIVDKVLKKFLNVNRQAPYMKKPEYKHLKKESNIEVYISSAYYKSNWMWNAFQSFTNMMCRGRKYFSVVFPYQLSLEHGILDEERLREEMEADDFDEIAFMMEMESLFFGESENAFYKLADVEECRNLVKAFYPTNKIDFLSNKGKQNKNKDFIKQEGEKRIISMDIAMMGGDKNDNTVFTLMRLLPNGEKYERQIPYIEPMNGAHSEKQAIRLKQLFYDFEADYVAMDTNGNGLSIYDDCAKVLYDEERDVEYPAWCAMNDENMRARALDSNALPVIFSIKVSKSEVNHEIAVHLRESLKKKKIKMLIEPNDAKDYLEKKYKLSELQSDDQIELLKPYLQTTILMNEMVNNLEADYSGGFVKIKAKGSKRKDRFSSLAYANYFAKVLESDLVHDGSDEDYMFFMQSGF